MPDAYSTTDLHLRTIPRLSIDFSTQNSLRARLYPNDFTFFNGYTDPAALHWQRGFFALSGRPTFFNNTNGPFSRLHLVDSTKAGSSVFGDPAFPEGFAIERTEAMRGREMSLILRASLNSKLNDLIHHNSALGLLETFQTRAPKHEIARTLALQWRECYI